ncbi:MAG: T9SS type A sorting domain-containing protein [Bacteroidia bacterium]
MYPPPPACDVAIDTVATNCLSDSTFEVVVTLSGSGSNLSISDDQGTTPLTGLSAGTYAFGSYANNTSVTIYAADLNLVACADTAAPVTADCTPPPACDVAIDTVATNCLSDSTFEVVVTLSGFGSNLSISDDQGTTPLTGLSAGTYAFGSYANNTSVTIYAADLNLVACADTAAPVTADCTPPPACDVALDTVATNCLSDSTFEVVVTLSGSGSNLSISDDQGTTPLTGLSAGTYAFGSYANNTSVTIYAADLNLVACADTAAPVTADCTPPPACDVVIDSVVTNCVTDSTFEVVVTFSGTGSAFSISDDKGTPPATGLIAGTYMYGSYNSGDFVSIFVNDANIAGCNDNAGPFTANCAPPVCDVTFDTIYSLCVTDSTFEVVVKIGGSGSNYQLEDDQGNPPTVGLSAGTYNLGPYYNSTDVYVTVTDLNFGSGCSFFNGPVTADCTPVPVCDVKFDSISAVCNTDSTFQIKVTISGSQSSYIISDNKGTPMLTGLVPGTYTYGTYASNDSVILQVSDPGIFGCVKFSPVISTKCDSTVAPKPPVALPKVIYMSNFFPNPADGQTSIKVFMPYVGKVRWDLVNSQGKIVAFGDVVLNPGENTLPFNTTKMLSGIYVMNFYMAGLLLDSKKLMILH